jgi:hypothetical protein
MDLLNGTCTEYHSGSRADEVGAAPVVFDLSAAGTRRADDQDDWYVFVQGRVVFLLMDI